MPLLITRLGASQNIGLVAFTVFVAGRIGWVVGDAISRRSGQSGDRRAPRLGRVDEGSTTIHRRAR